jgi:glycine/D-amino acid oxidase-like deaminating enzyme
MKVAIIGGGVFGSVIGLRLATAGINVSIFERNPSILLGSTPKSVMRLHQGLHYPRDLETAVQSRLGYQRFLDAFGDSIDVGFENFYSVAKNGSKVSTSDFMDFLEAAKIPVIRRDPSDLLEFGFAPAAIDSLFASQEGVIDVDSLRADLESRIDNSDISTVFSTEISSVVQSKGHWFLESPGTERFGPFDFVVQATYGSDRIQHHGFKAKVGQREFHQTLVVRANLGLRKFGMTVVDGDFLTVLPDAFADTHLLYGPSVSVLRRARGGIIPSEFTSDISVVEASTNAIIKRYAEWFPDAPETEFIENLITTRAIESGVEASDRRVTEIQEVGPSMLSVLSGKIDHCFWAADKCLDLINAE